MYYKNLKHAKLKFVTYSLVSIMVLGIITPASASAPTSNSLKSFKVNSKVFDKMFPAKTVSSELYSRVRTKTITHKQARSFSRTSFKQKDLVAVLSKAGFKGKNLKSAWAVAMRESMGHNYSHNVNRYTGDNSYGLFQINMIGQLGVNRRAKYNLKSNNELFNPLTNSKIAYQMSSGGRDWGSWGIGNGAYRNKQAGYFAWLTKFPS